MATLQPLELVEVLLALSRWLKAKRKAASLTQRALVERVKAMRRTTLCPPRICEFEKGEKMPSWRQLVDIMDGLDLSERERAAGEALWKSAQLSHETSELGADPASLSEATTELA